MAKSDHFTGQVQKHLGLKMPIMHRTQNTEGYNARIHMGSDPHDGITERIAELSRMGLDEFKAGLEKQEWKGITDIRDKVIMQFMYRASLGDMDATKLLINVLGVHEKNKQKEREREELAKQEHTHEHDLFTDQQVEDAWEHILSGESSEPAKGSGEQLFLSE